MCRELICLTSFVLLSVAVPSIAFAQPENLLPNSSFEEDEIILNDPNWEWWCTWGDQDGLNSTVEIDETEYIDGKRSLRIEPQGPENWHFIVVNISFPADLDKDYTVSFWAKAQEPRPLAVQMKASDNSVSGWGETGFEITTEWAEYHYTSNVLHDDVKLEFLCAASDVIFWMDFVLVYEGEYVAGIEPGGTPRVKATAPNPADGAIITDIWANLSWQPGIKAVSHDVYFGDNFDDVSTGSEGTFVGNRTATFIVVGFPGFPYPDGLISGVTYYWRIDEVNEADPNSPWQGDVWSFSAPSKTAYFPEPADSAEGVTTNVTLGWTPGFGAKLHTVYFGDNFEDVNSATGGKSQGTTTYSPGTLKMARTYYWRVDEFDVAETYKGDIWSFTTVGAVSALNPVNGAVDVTQTPVLTWMPGFGDSYEIYFGTDPSALELKGSGNLGEETCEPGQLEWNTTYYWRVDEVNNANADSPWTGPLWSFTTANFLIIDDMESYNDLDPADTASNRIFNAWIDGYDDPANGSLVGYDNPPFTEQRIVHSGSQSMPFFYDNTVGKSEATLSLASNRDWTVNNVNNLTIWFRGYTDNAAEPMYVVLNGSAVVTNENIGAARATSWTQWNINLQAFADQGINLSSVNSITLGFGNRSNPVAGGTGTVFFDDIRLYAP
ncbi:MAG: carbohydrate binding domain-containing protein [Sedimentisphaerales bacterium]|nr:carbohydrate binding domain-containing protein [Sedimentisphaerales bacterium]